jgi:hypothetical protein
MKNIHEDDEEVNRQIRKSINAKSTSFIEMFPFRLNSQEEKEEIKKEEPIIEGKNFI